MSFHQIKSEIKVEPEWQPDIKQQVGDTLQEVVGRESRPTVKCPGCLAVYSGNRSGLKALGHHIINSHRRRAMLYRSRLRAQFSAYFTQDKKSD